MKKTIVLLALAGLVLALAPAAQAAIIKVDNRNEAPSVAGWNVADDVANSPFVFGGFTFTYTGIWNMSGYEAEGAFDGTFWNDVATDRFYVNSGDTGSIAISGLNDALTYNLQLVGSDDNYNRAGDYKVNDSFGDVAGPLGGDGYDARLNGYDNADVMTFSNVSPSSGVITITVTPTSNNPAILGAFTIEEVPVGGGFDFGPKPGHGDPVSVDDPLALSWLYLPDCNDLSDTASVVVYWDTEPNGVGGTQTLTPTALTVQTVDVAGDLEIGTYYWKIVATDPNFEGSGTPGVLAEAVYSLITTSDNVAPVVDALIGEDNHNLFTFLTEGIVAVPMDASVVDEDDTDNSWTFTKDPDTIADPTFSDPVDALNVTVTFTEAGTYTLTLTADDGEADPVDDSLVVTVYADGCEAAKVETPYSATDARELGDTNYDCKVDFVDLAAMAEYWLADVSE